MRWLAANPHHDDPSPIRLLSRPRPPRIPVDLGGRSYDIIVQEGLLVTRAAPGKSWSGNRRSHHHERHRQALYAGRVLSA